MPVGKRKHSFWNQVSTSNEITRFANQGVIAYIEEVPARADVEEHCGNSPYARTPLAVRRPTRRFRERTYYLELHFVAAPETPRLLAQSVSSFVRTLE